MQRLGPSLARTRGAICHKGSYSNRRRRHEGEDTYEKTGTLLARDWGDFWGTRHAMGHILTQWPIACYNVENSLRMQGIFFVLCNLLIWRRGGDSNPGGSF